MSLKVKTAQGSMLMGLSLLASRPITVAMGIVLLRLLSPEDFGTVALAMILVNSSNMFTDLSMRSAVIQSEEDIAKIAWYAFIIVNATSILAYILVYIFALPISQFLGGDASTVPVLRTLGLIIVLDGLWTIPEALMTRDMAFKQISWIKVVPEIAYGAVAIVLALMGFGVYSLVWGTLLAELLRVVFCWWKSTPRYYLRPQPWDWDLVRGLFRFALPATSSSMLWWVVRNVDDWYVSRSLGTAALGFYTKAYQTTSRLILLFTGTLFGSVLQPSYAKVQQQTDRLMRGYLKSTNMVMLIMAPISFGLAVLAHTIVLVLLGEKWLPMVVAWQVFSLYTLTKPISTNASPLFLAVGKPRYNLEGGVVLLVVMVPLMVLLMGPYGFVGVAIAVAVSHTIGMLYNVFRVNTLLPGSALKTLTGSLPFLAAGALMAVGVQMLRTPVYLLTGGENLFSLILLIGVGALIYLSLIVVLQRTFILELLELTNSALGNRLPIGRFLAQRK